MLIYKDIITGDEMFTDAYPLKLIDDAIFEVEGKSLTEKSGISDNLIGGNASTEVAEGGAEALADGSTTGMDLIIGCKLIETKFAKADFKIYIKGYIAEISEHIKKTNPDRLPIFKAAVQPFVTKLMASFKDWQFYIGESSNPAGGVGFLNYREDQVTPYMVFFRDGYNVEKQ